MRAKYENWTRLIGGTVPGWLELDLGTASNDDEGVEEVRLDAARGEPTQNCLLNLDLDKVYQIRYANNFGINRVLCYI